MTPALHKNERRYGWMFLIAIAVLFAIGAFVAWFTVQPALDFLLTAGGSSVQPLLSADKYLTLVALMLAAFGVAFEFPVLLVFLLLVRIVTTAQLRCRPALHDHGDRDLRRDHHPELRPVHPILHGYSDVPLLRDLDRDRTE